MRRLARRVVRVALVALVSLVALVALGGCRNAAVEPAFPPRDEVRDWLVVLYMLADNELSIHAEQVIRACERHPNHDAWAHIAAVVQLRGGTARRYVVVPDPVGTETIRSPWEPAAGTDVYDPRTLTSELRALQSVLPARRTMVILWGHGSGWRGFGARDELRATEGDAAWELPWSGETIGAAIAEARPDYLVLDGAWTAYVELIYGITASVDTTVIATAGPLEAAGWSFDALLDALATTDGESAAVVEAFRAAYAETEPGGALVWTDSESLAAEVRRLDALLSAAQPPTWEAGAPYRSAFAAATTAHALPNGEFDLSLALETLHRTFGAPSHHEGLRHAHIHYLTTDAAGFAVRHSERYSQPRLSQDLRWAPDLAGESGFLYHLWYRR